MESRSESSGTDGRAPDRPGGRITLGVVMVAFAYFAIVCTTIVAVIHDLSSPDLYTGALTSWIGWLTVWRLVRLRGRERAAVRGFALANLVGLVGVLLFYQIADIHFRVEKTADVFGMVLLMVVPPGLAFSAGNLGARVALRIADRRRAGDADADAEA